MRTLLLSIMAAVSVWTAAAQQADYVPLVREGVEWGYSSSRNSDSNVGYMRQQFSGTTEIDGKTYHNLYAYSEYCLNQSEPGTLLAYMREEGKKVYAKLVLPQTFANNRFPMVNDNDEEVLLYDFGLNVGDEFTLPSGKTVTCSEVGNVATANGSRRYIRFASNRYVYMLIQGIGPCPDPDDPWMSCTIATPYCEAVPAHPDPKIYDLLMYERTVNSGVSAGWQGDITYKAPNFDPATTNDPSVKDWPKYSGQLDGIDNVDIDLNAPAEYFNLQGQRVENPANGLYIRRQGRKAVKVAL